MAIEQDDMITCAACGAANLPGRHFCRACGVALDGADLQNPAKSVSKGAVCPQCGKPLRVGARFCGVCGASTGELFAGGVGVADCPHCGSKLRVGARFCPGCGQAIVLPVSEATEIAGASDLSEDARSVPASDADATSGPGKVACEICGRPLRPGARFCPACRTPVEAPVPALPSQPAVVAVDPPVQNNFINRDIRGDILPLSELGGRYVIMEKVARGGMGAIYRATDKRLGNNAVAIKETDELMVPESSRQKVIDLFRREAELLATLRHPNLVRVTDSFQVEHYHYMTMEFIEGKTLQALLDAALEPFSEERVLKWAVQLCDVLTYLHGQDPKIIYRDMKPANVMVVKNSDEVKLIDFGIARFHKPGKRRDTVQFGTDGYAPPEQYGKMQTDERSDVYALGAMLHQLLTLRDPQSELFSFPTLRRLNSKVSQRVAGAIDKAVATNRDDRHQSVLAFRCALLGEPEPAVEPVEKDKGGGSFRSALLKHKDKETDASDVQGEVLDLGQVHRGASYVAGTLTVPVPPGDEMKVSSNRTWLEVSRATVDDESPDVQLILHPSRLSLGHLSLRGGPIRWWLGLHTSLLVLVLRRHTAAITCESSGVKLTSRAVVEVAPRGFWVFVGWLVTVLLLLAEIGAVVVAFVIGLSWGVW